jgi:ribosomal protein L25 (general stress protein Ctc)
MPATPIHTRRKQHAVEEALRKQNKNNPVFSSKYGGLEKEVEEEDKVKLSQAQIHEGKVRFFWRTPNLRT